jgi:hypothetical protein
MVFLLYLSIPIGIDPMETNKAYKFTTIKPPFFFFERP